VQFLGGADAGTKKMVNPHGSRALFQGWYVVGALFLVGFMLYGGGLYSFILFVPPLAKEFHWSSAGTGALVSAFFLSAPLSLCAVPLIRRFGEKQLIIIGIIIEAMSLMMLISVSSLWQMYLLRALAGFGKVLFAITLPIIISKWFSRRFGLAVAIMYSGWHLGGLGLAPLTEYLLSNVGWRATSVALGIVQLTIALPVTLWGLCAPSAADLGVQLDGDPAPHVEGRRQMAAEKTTSSPPHYLQLLRELVKHPAFQIIVIASPMYYLTYGGVLVHQAAVIEGSGATAFAASMVLGITAACAALGAVFGGWIFDEFSLTRNTLVAFSLLSTGVLCLLIATYKPSVGFLTMHAIVFGLAIGCGDIFWITLIKRRIPNGLFASAWGIWYFLQLTFIIIAPVCAGAIVDFTKSYRCMLMIETAILAVPLSLALLLASSRVKSDDTFAGDLRC
jgi:MFS family permease